MSYGDDAKYSDSQKNYDEYFGVNGKAGLDGKTNPIHNPNAYMSKSSSKSTTYKPKYSNKRNHKSSYKPDYSKTYHQSGYSRTYHKPSHPKTKQSYKRKRCTPRVPSS